MNLTNNKDFLYPEETYNIIGCAMTVHSELGNGFLEAVYQEALSLLFLKEKIPFQKEKSLSINFMGITLDKKYIADFVCYNKIILEIKAVKELNDNHTAQVINYLKATGIKVGLLINFGAKSLEYKRFVL